MKKKITSLALSAVLVLLAVFALNNEKIVNAADNLVALYRWIGRSCDYVRMNAILWHSFTGMFVIERRVNGWGDSSSKYHFCCGRISTYF